MKSLVDIDRRSSDPARLIDRQACFSLVEQILNRDAFRFLLLPRLNASELPFSYSLRNYFFSKVGTAPLAWNQHNLFFVRIDMDRVRLRLDLETGSGLFIIHSIYVSQLNAIEL